MKNPYKAKQEPTRRVVAEVGVEDWNRMQRIAPSWGMQDKLISTLFHQFVRQAGSELPHQYDPRNETDIADIIARFALIPIVRPRCGEAIRRGIEGSANPLRGTDQLASGKEEKDQ